MLGSGEGGGGASVNIRIFFDSGSQLFFLLYASICPRIGGDGAKLMLISEAQRIKDEGNLISIFLNQKSQKSITPQRPECGVCYLCVCVCVCVCVRA